MTPLKKVFRNLYERAKGTYYEGPECPARIGELVDEFARARPRATRAEWADMAKRLASEAYRSGYVRGWEWAERDLDRRDPAEDPEVAVEREGHGWRWRSALDGLPAEELGEDQAAGDVVPEHPDPDGVLIARYVVRANSGE